MDLEIRPAKSDEIDTYVRSTARVFGDPMDEELISMELQAYEAADSRTLAAFDQGGIVGTLSCHSFRMNVPGGSLPMAGVSDVTVRATHRRRGLMSQMMSRALNESRESGQALAALWASESNIYGRFGFGVAMLQEDWTIERQHTALSWERPLSGRIDFVEPNVAAGVFADAYARVYKARPGMIERNDILWGFRLFDAEPVREGASEYYHAVYEEDGRVDGYALYRLDAKAQLLRVEELVAATDDAYSALWRFCFGVDLMNTFRATNQPVDAPLPWMLAAPRQLRRAAGEEFWLRIVDVETALSVRGYALEDRLTIELRDPMCPWNERVIEVDGGPEGAVCKRSGKRADLVMSIADLSAAYLGAVRFSTLAHAGRVDEWTEGALRRADAMFATELRPWCIVHF